MDGREARLDGVEKWGWVWGGRPDSFWSSRGLFLPRVCLGVSSRSGLAASA